MTTMVTDISIEYMSLIDVFFQANDMSDIDVHELEIDINGYKHKVIAVSFNDDNELKISIMSLRHSGFKNMLEDYLLKCGINVHLLQPHSIRSQRCV